MKEKNNNSCIINKKKRNNIELKWKKKKINLNNQILDEVKRDKVHKWKRERKNN